MRQIEDWPWLFSWPGGFPCSDFLSRVLFIFVVSSPLTLKSRSREMVGKDKERAVPLFAGISEEVLERIISFLSVKEGAWKEEIPKKTEFEFWVSIPLLLLANDLAQANKRLCNAVKKGREKIEEGDEILDLLRQKIIAENDMTTGNSFFCSSVDVEILLQSSQNHTSKAKAKKQLSKEQSKYHCIKCKTRERLDALFWSVAFLVVLSKYPSSRSDSCWVAGIDYLWCSHPRVGDAVV